MKIILMRHGRPVIDLEALKCLRKSPAEIGEIIEVYKHVELNECQNVSKESITAAQQCDAMFSSDLKRALSSFVWLNKRSVSQSDACFREPEMPYLTWAAPRLKFQTWSILFWLSWFLGFSKNGEFVKHTRDRAVQGANLLSGAAHKNNAVLLLGHAIMNLLIARELKKMGWRKINSTGYNYWSYIEMEKF